MGWASGCSITVAPKFVFFLLCGTSMARRISHHTMLVHLVEMKEGGRRNMVEIMAQKWGDFVQLAGACLYFSSWCCHLREKGKAELLVRLIFWEPRPLCVYFLSASLFLSFSLVQISNHGTFAGWIAAIYFPFAGLSHDPPCRLLRAESLLFSHCWSSLLTRGVSTESFSFFSLCSPSCLRLTPRTRALLLPFIATRDQLFMFDLSWLEVSNNAWC